MSKIKIFVLFFLVSVSFSCKKLDDPAKNPERGDSYLKFVNAIPSSPMLDLFSQYYGQNTKIGSNLEYKRAQPITGYMKLQSSDDPSPSGGGTYYFYSMTSFASADTFIKKFPLQLKKDVYQTIMAIDSAGTNKFVAFQDQYSVPDSGFALVRFANVRFGSSALTLTASVANTTSAEFQQMTSFVSLPAGTHTFTVLDGSGNPIGELQNINIRNQKVYTFYIADQLNYFLQSE